MKNGTPTHLQYNPCLGCLVGGIIARPLGEFDVSVSPSDGQMGEVWWGNCLSLSLQRRQRKRRKGESGDCSREIVNEPTPVDLDRNLVDGHDRVLFVRDAAEGKKKSRTFDQVNRRSPVYFSHAVMSFLGRGPAAPSSTGPLSSERVDAAIQESVSSPALSASADTFFVYRVELITDVFNRIVSLVGKMRFDATIIHGMC